MHPGVEDHEVNILVGLTYFIGEGNGNPLQYSCLENPVDRGAWWAAVSGVAESDTAEATQQQQQWWRWGRAGDEETQSRVAEAKGPVRMSRGQGPTSGQGTV